MPFNEKSKKREVKKRGKKGRRIYFGRKGGGEGKKKEKSKRKTKTKGMHKVLGAGWEKGGTEQSQCIRKHSQRTECITLPKIISRERKNQGR